MGVRIQELPETTGIKKEDVLIVEDGQGTKKGTVQQLDETLGVSKLKEDIDNLCESLCENEIFILNKTKTFSAQTTGSYVSVVEKFVGLTVGKAYSIMLSNVENAVDDIVLTAEPMDDSDNRLAQIKVTKKNKYAYFTIPENTAYVNIVYRLSWNSIIEKGTIVTYEGVYLFSGRELKLKEHLISHVTDKLMTSCTPNLYNQLLSEIGFYSSITNGELISDNRYEVTDFIKVPSGKSIIVSGNDGEKRVFINSVRIANYYDSDKIFINGTEDYTKAYKYTNDSSSDRYVRFTLYYNHPISKISDIFIQIVDDVSIVDVDDYVPFIPQMDKALYEYVKKSNESTDIDYSNAIKEIKNKIHDAILSTPSLVYLWNSDCHEYPINKSRTETMETAISCMKAIAKETPLDGVINTGDVVDIACYSYLGYTNAQIYEVCSKHFNRFIGIGKHFLFTAGNHDGDEANIPIENRLYYNLGAKYMKDYLVMPDYPCCYGYLDHKDINTRIIMVGIPDGTNGLGMGSRQLQWLANNAFNTPTDYKVILCYHIPTCYLSWLEETNGFPNRTSFEGLVNAYHNHESFSDNNVSCDFTSKNGCKVVVALCGHTHNDEIIEVGQEYMDDDREVHESHLFNNLPCKQVLIASGVNLVFDAVVYLPESNLLKTFRFNNSSLDREIIVN